MLNSNNYSKEIVVFWGDGLDVGLVGRQHAL
jgi:hypothetical protein